MSEVGGVINISDIKNLDTCIFLDYVQDRCSQNFIQCIGRVLRKDKLNKKNLRLLYAKLIPEFL